MYLLAGAALLAIAAAVYFIATPPDRTPPPSPDNPQAGMQGDGAANGALPPGHPAVGQPPALTPEQEQQIAKAKAALQAAPKNDSLRLQLANQLFDAGQFSEAQSYYRDYVQRHPGDDSAHTFLAMSIGASGDLDRAIVELQKVLKHNPKHQQAAYVTAMIYYQKQNRDSTSYWLRRVAAIDSTTDEGRQAAEILAGLDSANRAAAGP
jgi:thioredoxin-like negative regulator of GroEL